MDRKQGGESVPWEYRSVVECSPTVPGVLGSTLSTATSKDRAVRQQKRDKDENCRTVVCPELALLTLRMFFLRYRSGVIRKCGHTVPLS